MLVFSYSTSFGQSYGLGFSSHEVVQDKRTSLDLSPDRQLCLGTNFDLSFDLAFFPNRAIYFGYIMRIIDDEGHNIDLVYNEKADKNHFNVIDGGKLTKLAFEIPKTLLFSQWNKISLKFDSDKDILELVCGQIKLQEKTLHLKKNACYKIIFGVNNYKSFQTTDVPPMRLSNIQISENGEKKYNWPLNEAKDQIAHEMLSDRNGLASNPLWISTLHREWQQALETTVNGVASVTFDPRKETVYVVGGDSLYSYAVNTQQWTKSEYAEGKLILNQGNQSFFNKDDSCIYNVYKDHDFVSRYSFASHTWDKKFEAGPVTIFWHANKLVSEKDSSLYLIGGYGQLNYKNTVQQYHFKTHIWNQIKTSGDFFMPRYLAALGSTPSGDTAYIIGGYGSADGRQILNPRNTYDMMRFTTIDHRFRKLFEVKPGDSDFVFANSMVIDTKSASYYGLIFPQHKYNSSLQLIKGSLSNPSYKLLGSPIPFSFHDTHSFADLYYCPASRMFVAVTLLRMEDNQTRVGIFTLVDPPLPPDEKQRQTAGLNFWYLLFTSFLLSGLILIIVKGRGQVRTKKTQKEQVHFQEEEDVNMAVQSLDQQTLDLKKELTDVRRNFRIGDSAFNSMQTELKELERGIKINKKEPQFKNTILLFGDLQVFDAQGCDITKQFTPLIKELFLVILLYSIRRGRGLSSEKLNEILWFDKSEKSARNNRSVNIAKLKALLDKMGYCHLSKDTGYWKIDIDFDQIYVDYQAYLSIIQDKKELDSEKIQRLSEITQRGDFLSNYDYEWLYSFKSEISNSVIDTYLHFAHSGAIADDPEMMLEVSSFIFYFDQVNEEAMVLKCKALSALGKHSLAKNTYENFTKEYQMIYGESFKKDFHGILE